MKTNSDKRINKYVKEINRLLKKDKYTQEYRVFQKTKQHIEDISYYTYTIVNTDRKEIIDYCAGTDNQLINFSQLLFTLNDAIGKDKQEKI